MNLANSENHDETALFVNECPNLPDVRCYLTLPLCSEKIVSEYDQEIPQSQTADTDPMAPRGRAT